MIGLNGAFIRPLALAAMFSLMGCTGGVADRSSSGSAGLTAAAAYTLGVTVSGLSGSGLVLQNGGADNLSVTANGSVTFATSIVDGSAYNVSVLAQPAAPVQTCSVSHGTGAISGASVSNVTVACTNKTTTTDAIGGSVAGLTGSGLVLQNAGGDDLSISANGPFTFPTAVASGTAYAISVLTPPTDPNQSCAITNGSGTAAASDVSSIVVTCMAQTGAAHTIGGTVSGITGTGATLVLQDNGRDSLTITSDGAFVFNTSIPAGGAYSVVAHTSGGTQSVTCALSNASGVVGTATVSNVTVSCLINVPVTLTTAGLAGIGLVVQDSAGDTFTVGGSGAASFLTAITPGAQYTFTVLDQPAVPSQTCTVTAGASGTVGTGANAAITVSVNCVTNQYTVGVSVAGLPNPLSGGALVLQDNQGDPLTIGANGSYAFATPVASGVAYAVTVGTQPGTSSSDVPANPQTDTVCVVSGGSGTITDANVTNVNVQCVYEPLGFAYVTNSSDNTVSSYLVASDGTLISSALPAPTGRGPSAVAGFVNTGPAGGVLYVTNAADNSVSIYALDANSGVPTLSGTITTGGLNTPTSMLIDPSGSFLYVTNAGSTPGSISQFNVVTNSLTPAPIAGAVGAGGRPVVGASNADVDCFAFNFFANSTSNTISVYAQDFATGALTPVVNPNAPLGTPTGPTPLSLAAVNSNALQATYIYTANSGDGTISSYTNDCNTGYLTAPAAGAVTPLGTGLASLASLDTSVGDSDRYYLYATTTAGIYGFTSAFLGATGPEIEAIDVPSPQGNPVAAGATPGPLATLTPSYAGPSSLYYAATVVAAVTNSFTVTLAAPNPLLAPGAVLQDIQPGPALPGNGVQAGTYVTAVNGNTITLSQAATLTANEVLHFYASFVYSLDTSGGSIYSFRADGGTGQLTQIGIPVATGRAPSGIFITPRPDLEQ